MEDQIVNELSEEMLGIHATNFAARWDSSSRAQMYGSHFSQKLVFDGMQEKWIQGIEKDLSKYTFSVKMPANGKILRAIDRYPLGVDRDSIPFNPETIVIYENDETGEIDYFSIPYYASYHQFFGYKYDIKQTVNELKPNSYIPKDTIFADSPGAVENGSYKYGANLNVAFMSLPSVSEDGIMISRDVLDRLKFRIYETRDVEFGSGTFPLNLYGHKDLYKPFPDCGEYIREDGVLMMLRRYDDDLMPVEMSIYDTMEADFVFDKGNYVRGGKGRVIDIKVIGNNVQNPRLPKGMSGHTEKYERALIKFHQTIIETEERLRSEQKRKYGENRLNISPKFQRLLVESAAVVNQSSTRAKNNLGLLYRKTPIDEYRIQFTIEYEIVPNIGFKLSDTHGPDTN